MDPPPLLHHQYTRAGFRRSDSRLETPPGNTRVAPWPTHQNQAIGTAAEGKPFQRRRNLSMTAMDLKAIESDQVQA